MTSPLKAGDRCEVVNGMMGKASPNIGLIVRTKSFRGEHSLYGRIWRCQAEYAELGQPGIDVPPGEADFAQSWLRKLDDPDKATPNQAERTKEKVL